MDMNSGVASTTTRAFFSDSQLWPSMDEGMKSLSQDLHIDYTKKNKEKLWRDRSFPTWMIIPFRKNAENIHRIMEPPLIVFRKLWM